MTALLMEHERSVPRWVTVVLLTLASVTILAVLQPQLILTPNTPTGGDMGAHVLGPAILRDQLLPNWQILGWSDDWFAGFPAYYFYFPLPSLVIVFLDLFLDYGVAFKIVTVLGLVAMPPATYFLARSMRLGSVGSLLAASGAVIFVFMESFNIYGGNIASSLAGEFSYSWSFALSLVYIGALIRGTRGGSRRWIAVAALALALAALSHILTTFVVIIGTLIALFWSWRRTLATWVVGFCVAAFWALPLIMRISYTSDMAWSPLVGADEVYPDEILLLLPVAVIGVIWAYRRGKSRMLPIFLSTVFPIIYYKIPAIAFEAFPETVGEHWKLWNGRLLPYWFFGVAFFAAVGAGAFVSWLGRRLPRSVSIRWLQIGVVLAAVTAAVLLYVNRPENYVMLIGGAIAIAFVLFVLSLFSGRINTTGLLSSAMTVTIVIAALLGVSFVDGWARWNYGGYEGRESFPEYIAFMDTMETLPPGRVLWEPFSDDSKARNLGQYGTPMAPMLIPYWTDDRHHSLEGLYFESSLSTPFHFIMAGEMASNPSNPIPGLQYHTMDFDRGIAHARLYGVRYYVAYNPQPPTDDETGEAKDENTRDAAMEHEDLQLVAESGPFSIFRINGPVELVETATMTPAVYEAPSVPYLKKLTGSEEVIVDGEPRTTFYRMALDWWEQMGTMDRWMTADGPEDWPRITSLDERPQEPIETSGEVSDVVIDDGTVSFSTTAVGVPHMVKVSYFPNWEVEGAMGPYRAAPSTMVVVPTEEEVVLEFRRQWPEILGIILTIVGTAGLIAWWVRSKGGDGDEAVPAASEELEPEPRTEPDEVPQPQPEPHESEDQPVPL